jgi:sugar/nucleoside kinase (ribokinase family)
LVSENSDRYSIVLPCLKYTDNLIINEIEAGMLTGIKPTDDNLIEIAKALKDKGVTERVIIHTPSLNVCVSNDGQTTMPSFKLPNGFIKGTTGAGDAFCAGALYSIYNEKTDEEILKTACLSAVSSLTEQDAISGVKSVEQLLELEKQL